MKFLETLRAEDGNIKHLNYHKRRMLYSAGKEIELKLNPPLTGVWRVRIIYSQVVESIEYIPYVQPSIKSLQMVEANSLNYSYKFEDRQDLKNLFEQRKSADDVLIVKNSLITDTTIANIAFFDGNDWLTPSSPLLNGTTRSRLIDDNFLIQANIKANEVKSFKKFALMNSLIGFLEIQNGIIRPC